MLDELYRYEIVPNNKLKEKLDFYYTPYNTKFLLRKHMTFEMPEEPIIEAKESKDTNVNTSLDLIPDKSAQPPVEVKDGVSTNSKGELNEKSIDNEDPKLEKKEWSKMKDIIFDTDDQVLKYLNFHCKRYRDAKFGRFSPPKSRIPK